MNQRSTAEIHRFPGSPSQRQWLNPAPEPASEKGSAARPDRYCVYNQSRERFISTDVAVAEGSDGIDDARLRSIGPGGRAALWIVPYREISASSVRLPLDLVLLSRDSVVLSIVESFPISGAFPPRAQAASMLVFPADTLPQGDILPGNQLIISAPEEMKGRLKRLQEAKDGAPGGANADSRQNQSPQLQAATSTESQSLSGTARNQGGAGTSSQGENRAESASMAEPAAAMTTTTESADAGGRPWVKRESSRNWFQRLLLGDSSEPRSAPRIAVPGLVAYFFTGGAPVPCQVRDISTSGLYLITNERWYIGTFIRLTLTDGKNPDTGRSLTVSARVARCGNDGVGLEFLLDGDNRLKTVYMGPDHRTGSVDANRVKDFIATLQSA